MDATLLSKNDSPLMLTELLNIDIAPGGDNAWASGRTSFEWCELNVNILCNNNRACGRRALRSTQAVTNGVLRHRSFRIHNNATLYQHNAQLHGRPQVALGC